MLGAIIQGAKWLGGYATGIAGASYGFDAAAKILSGSPQTAKLGAVIGGPVADTTMRFLDPFDWSGHRARKAKRVGGTLDKVQASIEKAVEKAEKKAEDFLAKGKELEAEHAKRWAALGREAAERARAEDDEGKALDLARAALELARKGEDPPSSALDVLPDETTDEGRAMLTSVVDSVNRMTEPFDAATVIDTMMNPTDYSDPTLPSEASADYQAQLAGACCASCAASGGTCGKSAGMVPPRFVNGTAHGEDPEDNNYEFFAFMNADEMSGDDDSPPAFELSGADLESTEDQFFELRFGDSRDKADNGGSFGLLAGPPRSFARAQWDAFCDPKRWEP